MVPKRYELTKSQKEILIVSNKSEICSQSFNESFILTFSCGIDIDLIIDSITSTFHKHDLLSAVLDRDSLTWKTESSELFLVEEYVSSDNEMSLLEDRINRHVYDLETGPLVRFFIIKEEEKISLCIHSHHILVDGYSMNLLLEDISFFYREGTNFDKVAGDFSHSFEDLIHAEKLDEYNMTEGIEFWKESLQNVPLPQDLPWNTRSGKQKLYEGDSTFYTINPEELQRIEQKAKEYKLSLHNFLLAMLFFVRHKLTDEKESVIGCPISSQNYYGLHGIFGNAVNLLPVKFIVDDRESVSQYFSRFKKNFFQVLCFANWTYNEILEKIPVKRSADRNPLIEMMFNLSTDQENWAFKDISYRTSRFKKIATNFDLYINCRLTSSSLNIAIDYNTNVYNEESIEKFYGCFKNVLDQICTDEVDNVKELNLLSNDQQIQKIQEWKGYLSAIDHSFVKDIIDNTTIYSERVAISGADISLTYKQLDILSNLVAQRLLINHSDSDVIGIAMTRTPYLVPVMLGILRAGKSYIPLDLDFPEDRLHYIIADSEIKCIIADEIPLDFVRSLDDNILLIDSAKIIKDEQNYPYDQKTLPEIGSDDPAYILYTSGSTGQPKGVMITHNNLTNFLQSMKIQPGFTPDDLLLAITTISFDISVLELFLPLFCGGALYIASKEELRESTNLSKLIRQVNPSIIQATPSSWKTTLSDQNYKFDNKKILCGGEFLDNELARKLINTKAEIWNMYGPTETTIWSSCYKVLNIEKQIPIGKPIQNTNFLILDTSRNLLPAGVPGELYIGGRGVSPGYWKKPELTNDKFHMNTIYDTSPIYATGDLVVEAEDGEIHFIGRMDNQLKIRGFRIEAGEIESVLRDIPSIEDAVVLAKKDKFNNSILVAYYIASDPTLDISSAKSVLKKKLPDYMIPSFFIQMEDFPRSPNMKIDHNSFPEYREIRNKKVEEHLSDLQLTLKNIWEDILGVSDFRIDDSFFDLGGHSLLITVLKKQTDRVLNMDIPILRFYQYPTIKSMSDNFETNNNNTNQLKNTKNLFKRKRAGSNCGR